MSELSFILPCDPCTLPLSVAPMIDWTYSHFRIFMRLIAPKALLYTEMLTAGAIKNNPEKSLHFHPLEQPLALQVGGADEKELALVAKIAEAQGFSEINLNLGCPSNKVQAGRFGACLMKEGALAARCIEAMKNSVSIPITAKTRIGVDEKDSYEFFTEFVYGLANSGCDKLIVHARKAWLTGLNPKQNRTIPPLHYDYAWRIKQKFPSMPVIINGNIKNVAETAEHMQHVDGIMVGRLACDNPYALAELHSYFYPHDAVKTRSEIMDAYLPYLTDAFTHGTSLSFLIKPLLNFAHGIPHSRRWKEQLLAAQQRKELSPILNASRWLEEQALP